MKRDPQIPDGWEVVRLDEIADIDRGLSWAREQESPVSQDAALPVVRIGNVQPDGFKMDDILYIRGITEAERSRRSITSRTLVMVGSNGNRDRVGNTFLANQQVIGHLLASFLIGIHPRNDVSERFLFSSLRSAKTQGLITESTAGSTGLKNLSLTWLRNLQVNLPPLPEQRAIAAVLGAIDAAIEGTEAVIAATERLRDALLHELLTRGVPGWHSEWKEAPGIGTIPACWEVVQLGDVANVAFSSVDKKTVEGELSVRLCNYTDVFYNRRITLQMGFMVATANSVERKRWSLKRGDVLFTKDSETPDEIGIPAFVEADMPNVLCGYHLGLARPDSQLLDGAYLAEALGSPKLSGQFARIANGVTRFGLTLGATNQLPIPMPTLAEQQTIAGLLEGVDATVAETKREQVRLESLKESTADALLTGRVRVGIV